MNEQIREPRPTDAAPQEDIAKLNRQLRVERSMSSRFASVRRGKILVGAMPPFGYDKSPDGGLVINEAEAPIVKDIFSWYVGNGLSLRKIATQLTEMAIPTRGDTLRMTRKKAPRGSWTASSVKVILNNPTYKGEWAYNKTRLVDGRRVRRAREEWITVEVPQIIEPELWARTQKHLTQRRRRRRKLPSPLVGHISCGSCGRSMVRQVRKRTIQQYVYWRCPGTRKGRCSMPTFPGQILEHTVSEWISELSETPEGERLMNDVVKIGAWDIGQIHEAIAQVEEEIVKEEATRTKVAEAYVEGAINKDKFDGLNQVARANLRALDRELQRLKHDIEIEMGKEPDDWEETQRSFWQEFLSTPLEKTWAESMALLKADTLEWMYDGFELDVIVRQIGNRKIANVKCKLGEMEINLV